MLRETLIAAIQELLEDANLRELDLIYRFVVHLVSK